MFVINDLHNQKYFNKFKSTEKIYITEMDLKMNLKGSYKNLFNKFSLDCCVQNTVRLCTQMNSNFFLLKVLRHVTEQTIVKCE